MHIFEHIDWGYLLAFAFLAWTVFSGGAAFVIARRFFPREPERAQLEPDHQVYPDHNLPEARFEPRERTEA
jgi:hypothetical protein